MPIRVSRLFEVFVQYDSRRTGRLLIREGANGIGLGNREELESSEGSQSRRISNETSGQILENR